MRVLILSPAVLDVVEARGRVRERPGGPALYAGAALAMAGDVPLALGPYGWRTLPTLEAEKRLGVERSGYPVPGPGTVFHLRILPGGERVAKPLSVAPSMGCEALSPVRRARPHAVIVSPVHADVAPCLLPLMRGPWLLAFDAQGFHRSGLSPAILRGAGDVAHASVEEEGDLPAGAASIVLVTSGPGPIRVLEGGRGVTVLEEAPGGPLEDATGAGDVFLALAVHALLRGKTPREAAVWAAGMVPRVLPKVQAMIDE